MATATTSDGVTIHFDTAGAGRDIVLIHGITDSIGSWGPVIADLAGDHRVTALDLRGMGRSGRARDDSAIGMARDVQAVVDAAGLVSPLVIGHSLGGVVATAFAAVGIVRGTINVDQPLALGAFQDGLRQAEPLLRDPETFPAVFDAVLSGLNGDAISPELNAELASHRRPDQEVVLGVWNQVLTSSLDDLDAVMGEVTAAISTPYLALHFVETPPGYDEWLRERIPHAEIEHWPGLGHYGHRIEAERFTARVRDFAG